MIAEICRKLCHNTTLFRAMSTKSKGQLTQSSLKNFVQVGDTKRRKMAEAADVSSGGAAKSNGLQFEETKGDLFSCPDTSSLAHCISADVRMGKGIAVIFKKKFQGVQELLNQGQKPGGCAILERQNRYIYYLVTKEKYWNKPTYDSLKASLQVMKTHCYDNAVKHLCMPRIGCGLDGLQWPKVVEIIKDVFKGQDIKITVYTL